MCACGVAVAVAALTSLRMDDGDDVVGRTLPLPTRWWHGIVILSCCYDVAPTRVGCGRPRLDDSLVPVRVFATPSTLHIWACMLWMIMVSLVLAVMISCVVVCCAGCDGDTLFGDVLTARAYIRGRVRLRLTLKTGGARVMHT